ncbi:hypothetical protein VP01_769g4 [Puccinia sorghi]|uniref:Uncharacterized protein n=1 Tax=Puccinia sorghi TaxID=27349 RepID=A0A0L6UDQ0_9BASI|nr:hypothetical protein VP01_769g4 [Puccinia sorghi]
MLLSLNSMSCEEIAQCFLSKDSALLCSDIAGSFNRLYHEGTPLVVSRCSKCAIARMAMMGSRLELSEDSSWSSSISPLPPFTKQPSEPKSHLCTFFFSSNILPLNSCTWHSRIWEDLVSFLSIILRLSFLNSIFFLSFHLSGCSHTTLLPSQHCTITFTKENGSLNQGRNGFNRGSSSQEEEKKEKERKKGILTIQILHSFSQTTKISFLSHVSKQLCGDGNKTSVRGDLLTKSAALEEALHEGKELVPGNMGQTELRLWNISWNIFCPCYNQMEEIVLYSNQNISSDDYSQFFIPLLPPIAENGKDCTKGTQNQQVEENGTDNLNTKFSEPGKSAEANLEDIDKMNKCCPLTIYSEVPCTPNPSDGSCPYANQNPSHKKGPSKQKTEKVNSSISTAYQVTSSKKYQFFDLNTTQLTAQFDWECDKHKKEKIEYFIGKKRSMRRIEINPLASSTTTLKSLFPCFTLLVFHALVLFYVHLVFYSPCFIILCHMDSSFFIPICDHTLSFFFLSVEFSFPIFCFPQTQIGPSLLFPSLVFLRTDHSFIGSYYSYILYIPCLHQYPVWFLNISFISPSIYTRSLGINKHFLALVIASLRITVVTYLTYLVYTTIRLFLTHNLNYLPLFHTLFTPIKALLIHPVFFQSKNMTHILYIDIMKNWYLSEEKRREGFIG